MYCNQTPVHTASLASTPALSPALTTSHNTQAMPLQLAYCSGLFDGDGCVGISRQQQLGRKNVSYRLTVSLVQNDFPTIQFFRDVLGVQHCLVEVRRSKSHNRQIYELRYDGRHALTALHMMLPYLVRKRIEAEVATDFWTVCQMGVMPGPKGLPKQVWKDRASFFTKMRKLK